MAVVGLLALMPALHKDCEDLVFSCFRASFFCQGLEDMDWAKGICVCVVVVVVVVGVVVFRCCFSWLLW
jgi:hypothetical protein